jgi:uncharacterized membrane protein (DUF485 family)
VSISDQGLKEGTGPDNDWKQVQDSPEFALLRRRLRTFVFPMTVLFLAWYLLYVLLADYAHGFMSMKLFGNINVGLIIGLLQFVSTFVITGLYVRYANRELDPIADKLRGEIEGDGGADIESVVEPEPVVEAEPEVDAKSDVDVDNAVDTEPETDAEPEVAAETEAEAEPEAAAESKADDADDKADAKAGAKSEGDGE